MQTVTLSRRVVIWCAVAVAALLIAVVVSVSILTATVSKRAEDDAYRACMSEANVASKTVDDTVRAAESCSR